MIAGVWELFQGVFGLILALLIWRATGNVWAWAALFAPGSVFVLIGCWKVWSNR